MGWLKKVSTPFKNSFVALATLLLISACGGTGDSEPAPPGGGGGTPPPPPAITVTLQLVSASTGATTQTITASNPGRVIATVSGITSSVIVTFSTDVGNIPVPTAITDAGGQASVDIFAGSALGAGTVTASVNTGESGAIVYAVGATNVRMGSGTPFAEGVAEVSTAQISAGGTTTVSVSIVDDSGNLFTEAVDVNFSSACSNATNPTANLSSPVATVNGVAISTYLAQGCVGDDPINVSANAGGVNLSASGMVNVLAADAGSIEFVSATPENIVIQGAGALGGSESSTVVFRVKDTNGNPVNGRLVDFSLNTQVGGIDFNPVSATTNAQGEVQTVVNSGTVATTVRVTAAINGTSPLISTQSSNLVVSTGIPDQDSFTLAAVTLNPEGWNIVGTTVEVTARLSDAFNNPVPDNTAVSFTTEGGSIEPSCLTVNGACSVIWTSQQPRPDGKTLAVNGTLPEIVNTMGQKFGGRATILATAIGEESFPDINPTNGRFDAAEMAAFAGTNISGNPYDLAEAFVDHNEDGVYGTGAGAETGGELEIYTDFNNDQSFTPADNLYNGVLCSIPAHAGCSTTQQSTNVRASIVLVMSGSNPEMTVALTGDAPFLSAGENVDSTLVLMGESTGFVSVIISDLHNQPMPAGTKVTFTPSAGSVVGPSSFTWPNDNHNGGSAFGVSIKGATTPKTGTLTIQVETPSGLNTVFVPISIVIQ